jgi:bisphosphoglycerate-independent phosphoglycerate mutase (AlkP superfamily)
VVIFNFRADRVLELTKAFEEDDFQPFDRKRVPKVTRKLAQLPRSQRQHWLSRA